MQRIHHTCTSIFDLGRNVRDCMIVAGRPVSLHARNDARFLLSRPNSPRLSSPIAKLFRLWPTVAKQTAEHLAGHLAEMCFGLAHGRTPARATVGRLA